MVHDVDHSEESRDESSKENNDLPSHLQNDKRQKSTARSPRSRRHRQVRDHSKTTRLDIHPHSSDSVSDKVSSNSQSHENASRLCSQSDTTPPTKAGEGDEYEVEGILQVRVYYRKLQYRVQWLGYEDDLAWYNASNFKNSPYKLREFHNANPAGPGHPMKLDWWEQCWEEGRDADDHPDDSRPARL